jgi:hypothetical protein
MGGRQSCAMSTLLASPHTTKISQTNTLDIAERPISAANTTLDAKNRVGFEALSYTWGDPKATLPITLHGKPHHITKNLEVALRHLRYPERERTLWVDALCIYLDRHRTKCHRNLRFEPQFCEGVGSED